MNAVFYFKEPTKLPHLARWLDINIISDLEQAAQTALPLVFWDCLETQIGQKELAIMAQRQSQGLTTKLVFDRSYEDCSEVAQFRAIADHYQSLGIRPGDLHYIINASIDIDPTIKDFVCDYATSIIDYFAIDAVKRVEQNPLLASSIPLSQRPDKINLLVSKLRSRHTRFRALYEFHRQGLWDHTVMGILATRQDMAYHVELYPEIYHRDLWWAMVDRLGSPDQTVTSHNDLDGQTSNTGWGQNSGIYDQSRISYVCETVDVMAGGHRGRNHLLISEKTYRSMINGTALIVQGAAGFLDNLTAQGYRTWSEFIDESYNRHSAASTEHIAPAVAAAAQLRTALSQNLELAQEISDWNRRVLEARAQRDLARVSADLERSVDAQAETT